MKRLIFIMLLICNCGIIYSQNFPLKSSKWYYSNNGGTQPPNSTLYIIEYEKDTIINDTLARKLSNGIYFYSNNDSVFFFNYKQDKFCLLYDFSAQIGDTIEISTPPDANTNEQSFKIRIDSIIEKVYSNDTLFTFYITTLNVNFYFKNFSYMTRIGATEFLPSWGMYIPEHDYVKCYEDSSIFINYSNIPCDSIIAGINENSSMTSFDIFPNPAKNVVNIHTELTGSYLFEIHDYLGKLRLKGIINENNIVLDISHFKSSLYFITIKTDKKLLLTRKLLIE